MAAVIAVFWQVITPIFLIAGLGYLLARRLGLSPRELSRAVFYLFSPCLLFNKLSHTVLSAADLGRIVAFAVLTITATGLLAWLVCRLLGLDQVQTSAFILVIIAGNTGNYGLPANQFAFGPAALEPAIVYYAVSTLAIATVGVYLTARGRRSATEALRNLRQVPLIYAALAGLLVWGTGWQMPLPIDRATALAGQAAVPVMLTLLGVQLAQVRLRDDLKTISLAAVTKLVGGAGIGITLAALLDLSGLTGQAAILEASMPTAVMATVLATEYEAAPRFTAGAVLVSTLGSLLTVTLVLAYLS